MAIAAAHQLRWTRFRQGKHDEEIYCRSYIFYHQRRRRFGGGSSDPRAANRAGRTTVLLDWFLYWRRARLDRNKSQIHNRGAPFAVTSASDKNGLTYGVMAGYNYQVGQLVLGVEGDFSGWTAGKIRYTAITGDFLTAHSKWGGSIRGRLGYAVDHALFYMTGGAAFLSNETSIPTTGITIGSDSTRVGWTIGAGLDYAFTNNWFTGLEYRYSQY